MCEICEWEGEMDLFIIPGGTKRDKEKLRDKWTNWPWRVQPETEKNTSSGKVE